MSRPQSSIEDFKTRMHQADFLITFSDCMGGTKIAMDAHAINRCHIRYMERMSMNLLAENVKDMLNAIPDMEDRLLDLEEGSKFTLYREEDGLVIFASFGILAGYIGCFVHSILAFGTKIFYEETNKLLLKICKDGSIQENTEEFILRDREKAHP